MAKVVTLPPPGGLRADGTLAGGWWHEDEASGRVVCDLCPRACSLKAGDRGFCFVRQNAGGEMVLTTYGRSTGFCIDPIEKKPLNHFYPGTSVLSFGTAGCNLGCKFCQNWDISKSREVERLSEVATPAAIAEAAVAHGCRSVAFTYNDPVIWAEYAIDTARACHERGLKAVAVTAGYITPEARGAFYEVMDAANVDLKAFTEEFYHHITYSHLRPVLETLEWLKKETDCWFEITNLVIPRANDAPDDLRRMCEWVLEHVGDDVPVHFTAFHPDFRMRDRPPTPHETLIMAYDLARAAGLKYVYTGNVDDARRQSTYCPGCGGVVIERNWYELGAYRLKGGRCAGCGGAVTGRFEDRPGGWGRRRLPVDISGFARPDARTTTAPTPRQAPEVRMGTVIEPQALAATARARAEPSVPPPRLSPEQKERVTEAAAGCVASAILRQPLSVPDPGLAGAAGLPVAGAYVTLKRRGHLRAYTGTLGRPMKLAEALRHAAYHTATEDHRLPPISPTELPHLDLSVNLLFDFRAVEARGLARVAAVEVGRHGVRLQRGQAGGLLLPGVATEHGWDSEGFLRHACRKAGLPSTAWEDDETSVCTFESVEFGKPLAEAADLPPELAGAPGPSDADLRRLAGHARDTLLALTRGLTASYYAFGIPDGTVSGVALTVDLAGPGAEPAPARHFARFALRPGVALQATVFELCEAAARALGPGLAAAGPAGPRVGLTVLTDPAMHGTVVDPDLRGVDPGARALLAVEGEKVAWAFDRSRPAEGLLEVVGGRLGPLSPARAGVFSLSARSTEAEVVYDSVPRPVPAPPGAVRPPAVAGTFYPADPGELTRMVDGMLGATDRRPGRWAAAMVPHAGLVYSGKLAAAVLNRLEFPGLVLVVGPKHTRLGVDWSVAPHEAWSVPGATVASDPAFARALAEAVPGLALDAAAHQREHAVEVELPFLARLAPGSRVVGVAVGGGDWEACSRFAAGLAGVIRGLPEPPLMLISSDMNHFANERETRLLDETALRAMERLDPAHLLETVTAHDISMCGVLPAVIVMEALRQLGGLTGLERVGHATSADVNGDTGRVVGYAGVLLN
jgi:AmmeMemoRadiSam system radical SAM enzyme/AmmeMemoRadiSam system protein B/uncharacterized protein (TIGR00296 family)